MLGLPLPLTPTAEAGGADTQLSPATAVCGWVATRELQGAACAHPAEAEVAAAHAYFVSAMVASSDSSDSCGSEQQWQERRSSKAGVAAGMALLASLALVSRSGEAGVAGFAAGLTLLASLALVSRSGEAGVAGVAAGLALLASLALQQGWRCWRRWRCSRAGVAGVAGVAAGATMAGVAAGLALLALLASLALQQERQGWRWTALLHPSTALPVGCCHLC